MQKKLLCQIYIYGLTVAEIKQMMNIFVLDLYSGALY